MIYFSFKSYALCDILDDLMPTMPGRGIGAGPSLNNLDNRGGNVRAPALTNANVNADYDRNDPIRLSNNARANNSGADTNGNFRNKNPQNVMPRAG